MIKVTAMIGKMSSAESESSKIYNAVLESMMKAVEGEEIILLTFEELRTRVGKMFGTKKISTGELRESIGALKSDVKIKSKKVAGREIYYLTEIVKVYKEHLSRKRQREKKGN